MRNTFVGLRQVDPAAIDAGLGMGMSRRQLFRRVEMPLAAPLVAEGVRIASVQSVGLAAVAALIGAGGLGFFIFQGFGSSTDLILLGAIPIIILALVVDTVMRLVVRLVTPKGISGGAA
jgi:osmoprotectant transport system permease protein